MYIIMAGEESNIYYPLPVAALFVFCSIVIYSFRAWRMSDPLEYLINALFYEDFVFDKKKSQLSIFPLFSVFFLYIYLLWTPRVFLA